MTNASQDAALSQAHLQEHPLVWHHGEHDASRFDDIAKPYYLGCAPHNKRSLALLLEVEHPQGKPRFQEIERYGPAHLTQPDESNTFLHVCFLSLLLLKIVRTTDLTFELRRQFLSLRLIHKYLFMPGCFSPQRYCGARGAGSSP